MASPAAQRMATQPAGFSLLPFSHYLVLGIARDASTDDVCSACQRHMQAHAAAPAWRRAGMALLGRHPARLMVACVELSDPMKRQHYDAYLDQIEVILLCRPY